MSTLIYKMLHIPTGKFYIGSLKDSKKWARYKTSSRTVKPMIMANPEEWTREILFETTDMSYYDVVALEERMIKSAVDLLGWDSLWNKRCGGKGQRFIPESEEKRRISITNSFTNERRQQLSERARTQVGVTHPCTEGVYVGTHVDTGNKIYFVGKKALKDAGFNQFSVWHCINGNRKTHKDYVWSKSDTYPSQDAIKKEIEL